jgi:transcription termination factor Rho
MAMVSCSSDYNYLASPDDIYQHLKSDYSDLEIQLRVWCPPKEGEKFFPLVKVLKINGHDPQVVRDRVSFEHLTPFPSENLMARQSTISTRIDCFSNRKRTTWYDCRSAKTVKPCC